MHLSKGTVHAAQAVVSFQQQEQPAWHAHEEVADLDRVLRRKFCCPLPVLLRVP